MIHVAGNTMNTEVIQKESSVNQLLAAIFSAAHYVNHYSQVIHCNHILKLLMEHNKVIKDFQTQAKR